MKQHNVYRYIFITSLSIMFLAGCDGASDKAKIPQEETLRKNGNALIVTGQFEEAVNVFDKLIKLNPKSVSAYNGKAVAFDNTGNHLAAQDIYKTALSISPNSLLTKNNLAMSLMLNNQSKQAAQLLEPLVKNKANKNSLHYNQLRYNLALAYALLEQHKKAAELDLPKMSKEEAEKKLSSYKKHSDDNEKQTGAGNKKEDIGFIASPSSKKIKSKESKPSKQSLEKPATKPTQASPKTVKKDNDSNSSSSLVVYKYPN